MKNDELIRFSFSRGGDMRGSRLEEELALLEDGSVALTVSYREWYDAEEKTGTYYLDPKVLKDVADVFDEYGMAGWDSKSINDVFIADGASTRFGFDFGDKRYGFSAQMYPGRYREGVNKLQDTIDKYTGEKVLLAIRD